MLKHMTKKPKAPPRGITNKANGDLITSPQEVAEIWQNILGNKFDSTKKEKEERPEMPSLPVHREATAALTRAEFDDAVNLMSNLKAVGPDGVSSEATKFSPAVRIIIIVDLALG